MVNRSPVSRTLPTGSARRRASHLETAGRAQPVAVAVDAPKRGGERWGRSPRPQAVGAGNRVTSSVAWTEAQTRPAAAVEQVSRALSGPRSGFPKGRGAGISERMVGRPARPNTRPGVQPGGRGWCASAALRLFVFPVRPSSYGGMNGVLRYTNHDNNGESHDESKGWAANGS